MYTFVCAHRNISAYYIYDSIYFVSHEISTIPICKCMKSTPPRPYLISFASPWNKLKTHIFDFWVRKIIFWQKCINRLWMMFPKVCLIVDFIRFANDKWPQMIFYRKWKYYYEMNMCVLVCFFCIWHSLSFGGITQPHLKIIHFHFLHTIIFKYNVHFRWCLFLCHERKKVIYMNFFCKSVKSNIKVN